jgi:hypothetical protein
MSTICAENAALKVEFTASGQNKHKTLAPNSTLGSDLHLNNMGTKLPNMES